MSGGKLIAELYGNTGLTHSQTIMPMVQSLLSIAGAEAGEMDVFAVSVGPGSFTGLRIGIAAVKGMAMAAEKPCAPISTLHGLALNLPFHSGFIVPVLDARRMQVYTALFEGGIKGVTRVSGDEAISLDELSGRLSALPGYKILVGDGACLAAEELKKKEIEQIDVAPPPFLYQRAASLCVAAREMAAAGGLVAARELAPIYLRLPQAERELNNRQRESGIKYHGDKQKK